MTASFVQVDEENVELFKEESRIMASLNHPHVVSFKGFCETKTNLYVLSGLCTGGSLADFVYKHSPVSETPLLVFVL